MNKEEFMEKTVREQVEVMINMTECTTGALIKMLVDVHKMNGSSYDMLCNDLLKFANELISKDREEADRFIKELTNGTYSL